MITVRKANERGYANFGWLESQHSFSFGRYFDPAHMGFGPLRVINEDRVNAGGGFPPHPHANMEIISYVISGSLEHKDSEGNVAIIKPGEVQRMTAGTGITHSEYNGSKEDPVHFLQIWVMPEQDGIKPGYEQTFFPDEERRNALRLVASRTGAQGSITVHQDVNLYASTLEAGEDVSLTASAGRGYWIQLIKGALEVNGTSLREGDGAAVENVEDLTFTASQESEFLLFDLPTKH